MPLLLFDIGEAALLGLRRITLHPAVGRDQRLAVDGALDRLGCRDAHCQNISGITKTRIRGLVVREKDERRIAAHNTAGKLYLIDCAVRGAAPSRVVERRGSLGAAGHREPRAQ